jgi:hypothetical protein
MTHYTPLIDAQIAKENAATERRLKYDNVKQPEHYQQYRFEPIKVRQDWDLPPMVDSALKYIARYRFKGKPIEDLEKAIQYLQREVDHMRGLVATAHATTLVIEEGEDG